MTFQHRGALTLDVTMYRGDFGHLGSDLHQIFLQEALLVGDFLGVLRLLLELIHLSVQNLKNRLQLVLPETQIVRNASYPLHPLYIHILTILLCSRVFIKRPTRHTPRVAIGGGPVAILGY